MKKIIHVLFIVMIFCSCTNEKKPESVVYQSETPQVREGEVWLSSRDLTTNRDFTSNKIETQERSEEPDWYSDRDFIYGPVTDEYIKNIQSLFPNLIKLTNCTKTFDYTVPYIISIPSGGDDYPPFHTIIESSIDKLGGITQVIIKEEISLDDKFVIIARNSKYEFTKTLEPEAIDTMSIFGFDDGPVYFKNFVFENKFWFSDGNDWHFSVKINDTILLSKELSQEMVYSLLYEKLDETPFVVNNLRNANLNNKYTYRCIYEKTEMIVVYYRHDGSLLFIPILYLIPDDNENKDYIDIGITWNDERLKGAYIFRNYKIDELPLEEKIQATFDRVLVR
ncbi:MAG: hypothetical protein FWD13_01295 [Treponema sp.]|nr:hypothetical protein [Treponema sp.]